MGRDPAPMLLSPTMLSRQAARLGAQLAGRALASEPALSSVRGAHSGRPDKDVHATTVLCVRKDGQASVGSAAAAAATAAAATAAACRCLAVPSLLASPPPPPSRWCWWRMAR